MAMWLVNFVAQAFDQVLDGFLRQPFRSGNLPCFPLILTQFSALPSPMPNSLPPCVFRLSPRYDALRRNERGGCSAFIPDVTHYDNIVSAAWAWSVRRVHFHTERENEDTQKLIGPGFNTCHG
jgi:hypothetical protein